MSAEEVDLILPAGKIIAKRSSSSLLSKLKRPSFSSGFSDNSSHSVQSKASMVSMSSKQSKQTYSDDKSHQDSVKSKDPKKSKKKSLRDHEYAYLYDLIDISDDGKLSTIEFISALERNPSVAEVTYMLAFLCPNFNFYLIVRFWICPASSANMMALVTKL